MGLKPNLPLVVATRTSIALLIVGLGVGVFRGLVWAKAEPPEPRLADSRPRIRVMRPGIVSVRRQFGGFGTARAMETSDVPAEVTATVASVPTEIEPGASVSQGQIIATLDDSDFKQQIDVISERVNQISAQIERLDIDEVAAKRRLELAQEEQEIAERDLNRVQTAYEARDAKEFELDRARSAVKASQRTTTLVQAEVDRLAPERLRLDAQKNELSAQRAIAVRNQERCIIVSPIAGAIETLDIELGEQVSPGQRVARVISLARIEVPIRLGASARPYVRIGDISSLLSTGSTQETWKGRVLRIGPQDDDSTRTFPVYVEVVQDPSDPNRLSPGRYVEGIVEDAAEQPRMVVPRRSVETNRLLIVNDDHLESQSIVVDFLVRATFPELDLPNEDYWAVLHEPLNTGSLVALSSATDVPIGSTVQAIVVNRPLAANRAGEDVVADSNR